MKKISLLTLLLLSSSFVYADTQWITVSSEYKGDCREMMCDCVEDSDGNGHCCPTGTSFTNMGGSHTTYTPCKCPQDTPFWDGEKCVKCVTSAQCKGECPVCMNGKCSNSAEVIVPQFGIFAHSTACYAIKEIAHLGPYNCPYDIYVKGHIDDTFLVKDISGKTVCNPNNKQHHMADGILYTIPAGQEVKVYAKDTACAIIAWERDYHGAEARTPQPPTMKIIRSIRTPGFCNTDI